MRATWRRPFRVQREGGSVLKLSQGRSNFALLSSHLGQVLQRFFLLAAHPDAQINNKAPNNKIRVRFFIIQKYKKVWQLDSVATRQ
jgi:hypothetical protein